MPATPMRNISWRFRAPHKVLLGRRSTRGLGAGALPQVGEAAALEAEPEIKKTPGGRQPGLRNRGNGRRDRHWFCGYDSADAKEMGALTVAVVTTPFKGEGRPPHGECGMGLERLRNVADTVIVVRTTKLLELSRGSR